MAHKHHFCLSWSGNHARPADHRWHTYYSYLKEKRVKPGNLRNRNYLCRRSGNIGHKSTVTFYPHVTVLHSNKFRFNKTNRRTNFPNLFCQETLHVSGSSSAHHQEFSTVHSAMAYVIEVCRQLSSRTRMELQFHPGPARKLLVLLKSSTVTVLQERLFPTSKIFTAT